MQSWMNLNTCIQPAETIDSTQERSRRECRLGGAVGDKSLG